MNLSLFWGVQLTIKFFTPNFELLYVFVHLSHCIPSTLLSIAFFPPQLTTVQTEMIYRVQEFKK